MNFQQEKTIEYAAKMHTVWGWAYSMTSLQEWINEHTPVHVEARNVIEFFNSHRTENRNTLEIIR